jgi:hypothetical protein
MRSYLLLCLLFLLSLCINAQEQTFEKLLLFSNSKPEVIKEGEKVKGYYFFYQLDKKDNKDNLYLLTTFDEKLNETASRGFKIPVKQRLLSLQHNGSDFCLQVFDPAGSQYEYTFLDGDLKEAGKMSQKVPRDIAYNVALQQRYHTLISLPSGFAVHGVYPESKKWEMHAYNNQGAAIWTQTSGNSDKWKTESILPLNGNTRHVVLFETYTKYEKKRNVSKHFLRLLNERTGQEVFKTEITPQQTVTFYSLLETPKGYLLIGSYTDKKNPLLHGEALLEFSSDGKIESEKYLSFTEITLKMREGQENRRTFQGKIIRIRDVIMYDRSYLMIADLYDKKEHITSGIYPVNIAVFELDRDLAVKDFHLLESTGSPSTKNRFLYSLHEDKGSSFEIVFDRELEPNSSSSIVGNAKYNRGKIKSGDVKMFPRASKYKILQAPSGKVAIFDYYETQKRASLRLEKF